MKKLGIILLMFITFTIYGCGEEDNSTQITPIEQGSISATIDNVRYNSYSVELNLLVSDDIESTKNKFRDIANEYKGYVEYSYEKDDSEIIATYRYRIPTESINDFLQDITKDGNIDIANKVLTVNDVTSEYEDYKAKIAVLELEKATYEKMLEKEDITTSEVLTITKSLQECVDKLATNNKEKENIESTVKYSQVIVELEKGESFSSKMGNYLIYLKTLGEILFYIVLYLLPFAIVGVIVWFVCKKTKKKKPNTDKEG